MMAPPLELEAKFVSTRELPITNWDDCTTEIALPVNWNRQKILKTWLSLGKTWKVYTLKTWKVYKKYGKFIKNTESL